MYANENTLIKYKATVKGVPGKHLVLLNSGATHNVVAESLVKSGNIPTFRASQPIEAHMADGRPHISDI